MVMDEVDKIMENYPKFPYWIYLHTNDSLIVKNKVVVGEVPDEYFESPFVRDFWFVENREDLIYVVAQADILRQQ